MCNRFINKEGASIYRKISDEKWAELIKNTFSPSAVQPDKPTNSYCLVLDKKNGDFNLSEMQWGYYFPNTVRPYWNLQAETLFKIKPTRDNFLKSRAIVGANIFYAKGKEGNTEVPIKVSLPDYPEFYFPCLVGEQSGQKNFVIFTIPSNEYMREIHDRMPVILTPDKAKAFLDDDESNLLKYMQPLDDSIKMSSAIDLNLAKPKAKKLVAQKMQLFLTDEDNISEN